MEKREMEKVILELEKVDEQSQPGFRKVVHSLNGVDYNLTRTANTTVFDDFISNVNREKGLKWGWICSSVMRTEEYMVLVKKEFCVFYGSGFTVPLLDGFLHSSDHSFFTTDGRRGRFWSSLKGDTKTKKDFNLMKISQKGESATSVAIKKLLEDKKKLNATNLDPANLSVPFFVVLLARQD